jgi:hypothetical protein
MPYDRRFGPEVFVFLDNEAFSRLSVEERVAYLRKAVEAVKSGKRVITPNTPHYLKAAGRLAS